MAVKSSATFQQVLATLGSIVLIVVSLSLAQKILIPLVMAVLLTFILTPLVAALQRRGLKKVYAAVIVVLLVLALLGGLIWTVTSQLHTLASEMPQHQATITRKIASLRQESQGAIGRLWQMVQEISQEVEMASSPGGQTETPGESAPVIVKTEPASQFPSVTVVAVPLLEALASAGLVTVLLIFMLVQREDLRNRLLRLIGHGRLTSTTKALDDAAQRISRFLLTQSIINAVFGGLFGAGLFFIGVPFALLWGFLAGCLRFIPYIGIWIALLFPFTYSIAVFPGWLQPVLVIGLCIALELVTGNFLEPVLLGHSTGISPIALLVAAAFWTWLWGPIGLILSTPLTTCLVVLGKYVPQLAFLDVLLGDEPPLDTKVSYYQRLLARDQDEAVELIDEYLQTQAPETLYDDVLLSALLFAKRDQERGLLDDHDQGFIFQTTREILEDLADGSPAKDQEDAQTPPSKERTHVLVFGCAARDEADEVAMELLRQLLRPSGCRVEVLSDKVLSAEVVNRVEHECPDLICIASLPPGGLSQAQYLCKRLRARVPAVKIAVGRWGQKEDVEKMRERLRAAGADYVATSLAESRHQVLALMPVLEANTASEKDGMPDRPKVEKAKRAGDLVST
jgi:predicted PurR-regulated permease PerM/CheY-like chemotaxis protein